MRQISIHKALCLGWRQELWLRVTRRRGAHTTTPGDRQWQMGTHHWNSWSRPSRAHTDRCLERCSGRGHIYQHSELSERKKISINQSWHEKKPTTTQLLRSLGSHITKNNMRASQLLSILSSALSESTVEPNNSPLILLSPRKFLHFYCLIPLHTKLGQQGQGELSNPHFRSCFSGSQIHPLCAGKSGCGEINHKARDEGSTAQSRGHFLSMIQSPETMAAFLCEGIHIMTQQSRRCNVLDLSASHTHSVFSQYLDIEVIVKAN